MEENDVVSKGLEVNVLIYVVNLVVVYYFGNEVERIGLVNYHVHDDNKGHVDKKVLAKGRFIVDATVVNVHNHGYYSVDMVFLVN